jgi:stringent starvation protein B
MSDVIPFVPKKSAATPQDRLAALKREMAAMMLKENQTQFWIDSRVPGVELPEEHLGKQRLLLNFSYKFAPGDLDVGEQAISQTLSFDGRNFPVVIPWLAVYAIGDTFWTASIPHDAQVVLLGSTRMQELEAEAERAKLAAVPLPKKDELN